MKGKTEEREEREESFGCEVIVTTPATKCARVELSIRLVLPIEGGGGGRRLFAGHEVEVRVPLSLARYTRGPPLPPSYLTSVGRRTDGRTDGRKNGSEEEKPSSTCGRRENPMNEMIGPPSSFAKTETEIPALGGTGVSV